MDKEAYPYIFILIILGIMATLWITKTASGAALFPFRFMNRTQTNP